VLEDYVVRVRLPIEDERGFALGAGLGYHVDASTSDPPWYWDGQDIWLPPHNTTLYATFRGTLTFIPTGGTYFEWDASLTELYGAPLPAIGDALVIQVWPEDFVKLQFLLPPGSPIPKYVVYQNVIRDAAALSAEALIVDHAEHREHYRKVFTAEGDEGELSDEAFRERVRRWIQDEWLQHRGMGILVTTGDEIGEAALVPVTPPPSLPADVRVQHGAPTGADESTWGRLTFKVIAESLVYDPAFFYHLVASVERPDWTERPDASPDGERLLSQWRRLIQERRTIKVTHQLRASWSYGDPPDPEMPAAQSSLVIRLKREGESRPTLALYDPIESAEALWRVQGPIQEDSTYEWTFDGRPLYAQNIPDYISWDPRFPYPEVGVHTDRWFSFDGRHQFILGVNMTTCRTRSGHDLAANFFLPSTWQVWIEEAGNAPKLESDFQNIAAMGFSTVRIWAFEQMEGLDFGFEAQYEEVLRRVDASPSDTSFPLKRVEFRGDIYYACSDAEFRTLTRDWDLSVVRRGTRIEQLIRNAARVQTAAQAHGLRVLWTLWAQYGERLLGLQTTLWNDFIQVASAAAPAISQGRLPLQAWLYRALMTYPAFRSSYVAHAVQPLVNRLESTGGEHIIGYEVMNEANLHWADSGLRHALALGGTAAPEDIGQRIFINGRATGRNFRAMPTLWPLNQTQIHSFINECLNAIRTEAPDKIVLSGVTNTNLSQDQMILFYDPDEPLLQVDLSASAVTRYVTLEDWRTRTPDLSSPSSIYLRHHHDRCLFLEAGESLAPSIGYDCGRQQLLVEEILRTCYHNGFAGVFIWNYDDPERGPINNNYTNQNALTEYSPVPTSPHNHRMSVTFVDASPRPAAETITQFASGQRQFLLPSP
jgi:hypothetical protein